MFRLFPRNSQIPFMQVRRLAAALSLFLCLVSIWSLAMRGLNFGVDFAGGVQIVFSFDRQTGVDAEVLRQSMAEIGLEASVQSFGSDLADITEDRQSRERQDFIVHFSGDFFEEELLQSLLEQSLQSQFGERPTAYIESIRTAGTDKIFLRVAETLDMDLLKPAVESVDFGVLQLLEFAAFGSAEQREYQLLFRDPSSRIQSLLAEQFAAPEIAEPVRIEKVDFVGARVGADLKWDAILSVIVTILLIFLYIYFQFDLIFAPGVVVALAHDVLITVGVFSLIGMEFDLTTVAALLTVAGYSINDTIVVYDRIRETRAEYRGKSLLDIMNIAINQTLSRTVITSGTTLMATAVLFFFGGPVIHSFAFALTIGVLVGTYSSVFVAAPLVLLTHHLMGDRAKAKTRQQAA